MMDNQRSAMKKPQNGGIKHSTVTEQHYKRQILHVIHKKLYVVHKKQKTIRNATRQTRFGRKHLLKNSSVRWYLTISDPFYEGD
jgi:hypothetical protein